ncbi:Brp/Blh family beta-carotene 15,15'-dioxygenase [Flavobacterium sp. LB2R40]|uniref:Brp/Blh family beta-carotene 15,15'-dioxygenase n=1 Tax=unclassified Flavobacterium TaxID=196869 RepID=UPI003AB1045F
MKYSNISIVASFFGLWMDSYFSTDLQLFTGFFLIFTFGILHGANDLLLIENINSKKRPIAHLTIPRYYLVVVLSGAFLFYILPWFALLLFIVVSSYHFGEQQWQDLQEEFSQWILIAFQFSYGLFILLLLFNFHQNEVIQVIWNISNISIAPIYITGLVGSSGAVVLTLSGYIYWKSKQIRKKLLTEIFHLILFTIIFKSSSLIWGFALYFVLWHSIPSIIDQIKFLHGNYSFRHFLTYCRAAAIYWFISIMGITVLYFLFKEEQLFNALFFSFLAAITFPHAVVITRMFHIKKQ